MLRVELTLLVAGRPWYSEAASPERAASATAPASALKPSKKSFLVVYLNHSLNFLKGSYLGDNIREYYKAYLLRGYYIAHLGPIDMLAVYWGGGGVEKF